MKSIPFFIFNKKDRRANFFKKKVHCAWFFRMCAGNTKQEINLTWPNVLQQLFYYYQYYYHTHYHN